MIVGETKADRILAEFRRIAALHGAFDLDAEVHYEHGTWLFTRRFGRDTHTVDITSYANSLGFPRPWGCVPQLRLPKTKGTYGGI